MFLWCNVIKFTLRNKFFTLWSIWFVKALRVSMACFRWPRKILIICFLLHFQLIGLLSSQCWLFDWYFSQSRWNITFNWLVSGRCYLNRSYINSLYWLIIKNIFASSTLKLMILVNMIDWSIFIWCFILTVSFLFDIQLLQLSFLILLNWLSIFIIILWNCWKALNLIVLFIKH